MRKNALKWLLPTASSLLLAITLLDSVPSSSAPEPPHTEALTILARCQTCHGKAMPAGGLNLTSRSGALKGGKSGPALLPKDLLHSPLLLQASSGKMPPGNPLSRAEVESFKAWIGSGATWSKEVNTAPKRAGLDWWSLQPIVSPKIPIVKNRNWVRNPIDAFVLSTLQAKGLRPAPPAENRTLIRRAYFDLLGLPPSPEEVEAFVRDSDPRAYEKLIDRLLASPHYGERWGRHWLDVARFGESAGYEYDRVRDHAWRYRDYVVRSFNADKPYGQFLREQIAGDVLPDAGPEGVIATGFLVAGPMDEAGKGAPGLLVRLRAREEEMEDIIGLVGQTCLGLTVNCSRCHDHKFDPITQRDYYRLKAALVGVDPGNRPTLSASLLKSQEAKIQSLKARQTEVRKSIAAIEGAVRSRLVQARTERPSGSAPVPYAKWTFDSDSRDVNIGLGGTLQGGAKVVNGRLSLPGSAAIFKTDALPVDIREKTLEAWVTLTDLTQHGGSVFTIETEGGGQFDAIVFGERERGKWIAGSESFQRTRDLEAPVETEAEKGMVHVAIVYRASNQIEVYRNGKPYGKAYTPTGANGTLRTYTAGKTHLLFGQRHTGSGDYLRGEFEEARLYNRALTPDEVAASYQNAPYHIPAEVLERALSAQDRKRRATLLVEEARMNAEQNALENPTLTYAAVSRQPEPTHILLRGDVQSKGELVTPGGIAALRACQPEFGLAADAREAERRIKLAHWITDPHNPLTSRVIVNRLWQYHFGHGIVGTANDFGYNGERPTHPALLDWLASSLMASPTQSAKGANPFACGGSLKKMHRLMMLSNTYRQSGAYNSRAAQFDAENRFLWRYAPRRLEAEAVRDSMLAVSGNLNLAMGGPSFRPFTIENFGSSFYRLEDKEGAEYNRRTLYRMIVHSARSPLLESLDCPDPSTKTPKRTSTTTPIQALELMNDTFVLRQAKGFAARVRQKAGSSPAPQIRLAYALAFGRLPTSTETQRALQHLKSHSLESFCWALYNASEFLYAR